MKILSIIIPCYNSQDYMRKCIDSLLPGGEDVEIIIVNDGSGDRTADIAEEYKSNYPDIVRVCNQVNGGHGAAINTGLANACGVFTKVVDSDDWVELSAYQRVLEALKQFPEEGRPDAVLCNYVYEKEGKERKTVIRYSNVLPQNRIFTWNDTGRFRKGQYLLMHSLIYRTDILKKCGLKLPKHTFYVDNLYAYIPLEYVDAMYYLDVDLYRYYIGREGQSVQEQIMIKRIDQQLTVNRLMVSKIDLDSVQAIRKRQYLFNYLEIMTMVSSALLLRAGTAEHLRKKQELWQFIRQSNRRLYRKLRYGLMGQTLNLPGTVGRRISVSAYKASQKVVGFN